MIHRRKHIVEENENHDRWLVSYADFITLLFAFFVVMYAISSVNQGKYRQLTNALGTAFTGSSSKPIVQDNPKQFAQRSDIQQRALSQTIGIPAIVASKGYAERLRKERENMTQMGIDLSNALAPLVSEGKVRVVQNNRGIRIDIHDSLLFAPGSAELALIAQDTLNEIAAILERSSNAVQVEGHTDNVPIHNAQFFSNWELSAVRASTVLRSLHDAGIVESRLSAVGFGAAQPVSDNDTPLGRAKNRRVSIMILYQNPAIPASDNAEIMPTSALNQAAQNRPAS